MKNFFHFLIIFLFAGAVALALRLPQLGNRPLHGDEANQMVRTDVLVETGRYEYDPLDHHGPVLYYAAAPIVRCFGGPSAVHSEIWMYRIVPVLFAILSILLINGLGIWKQNGMFAGVRSVLFAGLFTATSPVMVYYSRYFIQETLLCFFLLGMGVALRYYAFWPSWRSALMFGVCAGCALASKETAVMAFAAMAVAGWWAFGAHRVWLYWQTKHVLIALLMFVVTAVLWFTSFLTYPEGLSAACFHGVSAYAGKALDGSEHAHPWWWYGQILFYFKYGKGPVWSEALVLVPAFFAFYAGFRKNGVRALRFLTIYTVLLAAFHCAIPYKTPWCVMSVWGGVLLLAGAGVGSLWMDLKMFPNFRVTRTLLLLGMLWLLALQTLQAVRASYRMPSDPRNPYVYAHTAQDALDMIAYIRKRTGTGLAAFALPPSDTWPMPWYLKDIKAGYWTALDQIPAGTRPRVLVVPGATEELPKRFGTPVSSRFFAVRPGVLVSVVTFQD